MTPIVVEERNSHRKHNDIGDEQYEHNQVPIEAKITARMNDPVAHLLLPYLLLEHALLAAEQLHGQLIIRRLQHAHKVRLEISGIGGLARLGGQVRLVAATAERTAERVEAVAVRELLEQSALLAVAVDYIVGT